MKTVFILGAGASRECGGPLMYDFLDKASNLIRTGALRGNLEKLAAFEEVFNALSELHSSVHAKTYLDLYNFEIFFGAIEMARILKRFSSYPVEK